MGNIIFILLFSSTFVTFNSGYKSLMKKIPNADYVRNPCDNKQVWPGVGHFKPGGGGRRNQFGADFNTYGKTWSNEFCMLDSDQDGRTNGEELGDPTCTWTTGSILDVDPNTITHPGVCEPLGSDKCKFQDYWLGCQKQKFDCPAVDDPDTKNVTITLPKPRVPVKETSHMCMVFEFPEDGDFHMVATRPVIDNTKIVHHVAVFACVNDNHKAGELFECGLDFSAECNETLSVWALGMPGLCMHENTGFRIGNRGFKRLGLQLHWENHRLLPNEVDGSGVTIYYTEKRRKYDAGLLVVGQEYFNIPALKKSHVEVGHCYPECSKRQWSEDLHVTFALSHLHYLGQSMKIEHLRNGEVLQTISDEPNFIFDNPLIHTFKDPIVVSPGDELRTTCSWDSTLRNFTTPAGDGYFREMCYGFLQFYPKQAIRIGTPYCTSWKEIPYCRFALDDVVNGCNIKNVRNMEDPETKKIYDKVMRHCRPLGPCYSDCRRVVKEVTSLPCYHGDMWIWQRDEMAGTHLNHTLFTDWYRFYAAMDSCLLDENFIKSVIAENYDQDSGNLGSRVHSDVLILFYLFILSVVVFRF